MDSHDTNQPLNQGELEEEKKTVEVSEAITETPTEEANAEEQVETTSPVSYTHLTLPTIYSVVISVDAASLKKKKKH